MGTAVRRSTTLAQGQLWRVVRSGVAVEVLRAAINAGADVNRFDPESGRTPLHAAACSQGADRAVICDVLLQAAADPHARDCVGWTPLHYAADQPQIIPALPTVKRLLAAGADIQACSINATTPLHLATLRTSLMVARHLIVAGADPFPVDNWGKRADPLLEVSSCLIDGRMHQAIDHLRFHSLRHLADHPQEAGRLLERIATMHS